MSDVRRYNLRSCVQYEEIAFASGPTSHEAFSALLLIVAQDRIVMLGNTSKNLYLTSSADAFATGVGNIDFVLKKHVENGSVCRDIQCSL